MIYCLADAYLNWDGLQKTFGPLLAFVFLLLICFWLACSFLLPIAVYLMHRDVHKMRGMMESYIKADQYRSRQVVVQTQARK
jgi:hypothetical protein